MRRVLWFVDVVCGSGLLVLGIVALSRGHIPTEPWAYGLMALAFGVRVLSEAIRELLWSRP